MTLKEAKKHAKQIDKTLLAGKDFNHQVKVKHSDGSKFNVRHAKTEILEMYLIVYTEHHGILYFHCEDILYAKSRKEFSVDSKYKTIVDNR